MEGYIVEFDNELAYLWDDSAERETIFSLIAEEISYY